MAIIEAGGILAWRSDARLCSTALITCMRTLEDTMHHAAECRYLEHAWRPAWYSTLGTEEGNTGGACLIDQEIWGIFA